MGRNMINMRYKILTKYDSKTPQRNSIIYEK